MTTSKSHFEQVLFKIYSNIFCKYDQKVCIGRLKPRSNKNKFECKNCSCTDFYVLSYQNYLFKIVSSL